MQFGGARGYAAQAYGAPMKAAYHDGYDAMGGMNSHYGAFGQQSGIVEQTPPFRKKRLNIVAICLNVFAPWILFCSICYMLSFELHYAKPALCQTLVIIALIALFIFLGLDVAYIMWKRQRGDSSLSTSSWMVFLCVSCIVAVIMAVAVGNRNFWMNSQVFYDVTALNSYNAVDPARMRGQELMDAGRVLFAPGTHLDLSRSMGFKNQDTYCVAPITGGSVVGNPPLASYDFWAIGKDCCTGGTADFQCGEYSNPQARAGIRLVRDDDRAFFRLAVQQAQSAHQIKAVHPLFFHWVRDPVEDTYAYKHEAFKTMMVSMAAHLLFQIVIVGSAASVFAKLAA